MRPKKIWVLKPFFSGSP